MYIYVYNLICESVGGTEHVVCTSTSSLETSVSNVPLGEILLLKEAQFH